jgi:DNA-binding transcriptional LysR family regulator
MPALVPVLPALAPPPREAWLVVHRDVRKTARVAAVLDWLSTTRGALGS